MNFVSQLNGVYYAEDLALSQIVSDIGTPTYLYSANSLQKQWLCFDQAFHAVTHHIHYAVKANSNLALLDKFHRLGSGFDIVSAGELQRVLKVNADPQKIIFSGVGKRTEDLNLAIHSHIACINVESTEELLRVNECAGNAGYIMPIALRINPDIKSNTHPYISTGAASDKFGIPFSEAMTVYKMASTLQHLQLKGIAFHIGSQISTLAPFKEALHKILVLHRALKNEGILLSSLNVGGGLGIRYHEEVVPSIHEYAQALIEILVEQEATDLCLHLEPGRVMVAEAGILLTRIEYLKKAAAQKYFAIVDAGMNDLLRPALYNAWHPVQCLHQRKTDPNKQRCYDIVGPVCESGDFLAKDRWLDLELGDLIAIGTAGAYGFSMSSNYNSRPRPAEVLVDGSGYQVIRTRERLADLFAHEQIPKA